MAVASCVHQQKAAASPSLSRAAVMAVASSHLHVVQLDGQAVELEELDLRRVAALGDAAGHRRPRPHHLADRRPLEVGVRRVLVRPQRADLRTHAGGAWGLAWVVRLGGQEKALLGGQNAESGAYAEGRALRLVGKVGAVVRR